MNLCNSDNPIPDRIKRKDDCSKCELKFACDHLNDMDDFHRKFFVFMMYSMDLYLREDSQEFSVRMAIEALMEDIRPSEIKLLSEHRHSFFQELYGDFPIKVRAGIRRGYDLMVVASLSRY